MDELHNAVQSNNIIEVSLLLRNGANINSIEPHFKFTSLHFAVRDADIKMIKLLLQNNININAQDKDGWTALHIACYNHNEQKIKELLDWNADHTIKTFHGETIFDVTIQHKNSTNNVKADVCNLIHFYLIRKTILNLWEFDF